MAAPQDSPRVFLSAATEGTEYSPLPEDALIIIPVRGTVLFPGTLMPLTLGRKRSIAAAQEAMRSKRPVGLILQREAVLEDPAPSDLYRVGTVASVLRYVTGANGAHHLVCEGEARFRTLEYLNGYPFFVARVERMREQDETDVEIEARLDRLRKLAAETLDLMPQVPEGLPQTLAQTPNAAALCDLSASFLDLTPEEKQDFLETFELRARLDKMLEKLTRRIEVMRLSEHIGQKTRETMNKREREFLLREQLKTIQRELGEGDSAGAEIDELRQAIDAAAMPTEADEQARKELARLAHMSEASAEYSMTRTYVEWLTELPWSKLSAELLDIARARETLEHDHFGLDKVKKRILEYLAVRKLNPEGRSPILCFVGPPGVGKTSLGQSIARAVGLKFVRQSLGGTHDEAEIRGHRRTYIGALPGNIIQGLRKAGTRNPVFMLDEMDKLGASFHGDPASALLEVLDPEQNSSFRDNYLGVPFDLSKVFFIGTANVLDAIPGPLRDRLEVISLPGYTEHEKLQIARRYLIDRQRAANGLREEQLEITDGALTTVIRDYTREAGVRQLEREIGALCRRQAVEFAEGRRAMARIGSDQVADTLGARRFENEVAMRTSVAGVATGLAWTPTGGDILFVEATRIPGKGQLILTGQLGDVMKESAQAALSLVKSRADRLGVECELFEKNDIHIHVPAGAIPKDGPSAGAAMYIALASLLTGKPTRTDTAMTGEISLRGLVLPVGGIKEKAVAAMTAGITRLLLPARNRRDLEDIPEDARERLEFVWLDNVDEALQAALSEPAALVGDPGTLRRA